MRPAFFEMSTGTRGEVVQIPESRLDALIADREGYELFAAAKGDLVWARGGPIDETQRESRRGQRLFPVNVMPLINLARANRWLTPSQAAQLTDVADVPQPIADPTREVKYRKALEKGRRAVDIKLEQRGKLAVWRAFETGPVADNGERIYRFRRDALGFHGRPLLYCFVWMENLPADLKFHPIGAAGASLPLHDGSYQPVQAEHDGLRVTVRDAVLNGHTGEWVFLVDLHNTRQATQKHDGRLSIRSVGMQLNSIGLLGDSPRRGPRIRSLRHDVNRLRGNVGKGQFVAVLPPSWTYHYTSFAMPARDWVEQPAGPLRHVVFRISTEKRGVLDMQLPFRLLGPPPSPRFRRRGTTWCLQ